VGDALPRLCAEGERFDFVFIDGRHLFDCVLVDFFYVDRLLEVGGYVALDDLWMPAVRKVKSFILRNRSYELVPVPGETGTIEKGKRADLILLDADPLADIRSTTRRSGVMVRGRWLPQAEIEQRLAEVAKAVGN